MASVHFSLSICNFSSLSKSIVMNQPKINILTFTVSDMHALLDAKHITSTQLVQVCLDQIQQHNKAGLKLNAVLLTAPQEDLMRKASVLDDERARGHVRSPLHGLPILLKVRESRAWTLPRLIWKGLYFNAPWLGYEHVGRLLGPG